MKQIVSWLLMWCWVLVIWILKFFNQIMFSPQMPRSTLVRMCQRIRQGPAKWRCSKVRTSSVVSSLCWGQPSQPPISRESRSTGQILKYTPMSVLPVRWKGPSPGTAPPPRTRPSIPPREWEIWNLTGDAHPIHLHLVHFEVLDRWEIKFDTNADDDGFLTNGAADDGVYLVEQPTVQHNSVAGDLDTYGSGFRIVHPTDPRMRMETK